MHITLLRILNIEFTLIFRFPLEGHKRGAQKFETTILHPYGMSYV